MAMERIRILLVLLLTSTSLCGFAQSGFVNVNQTSGLQHRGFNRFQMGGGSAWFDYDNDGDEDLMTVGGLGENLLWRNNGDGTFTDVTQAAGLDVFTGYDTQGVVTGDVDNDGYREIFVSTVWHQPNFFFENNGDGTFTDASISSGLGLDSMWVSSAVFGDYDGDGLLDLYRANYLWLGVPIIDSTGAYVGYAHRCNGNSLHHNNGDGTFTDVGTQMMVNDTGCALSAVFTDYDGDHDPDLLIANDFGAWVAPSALYQSQFPAPYSNVSVATNMDAQMYGMGIAVGDYDHDQDLDYYVTDIGPNALFQQQANHTFTDQAANAGVLNDSIGPGLAIGWGDAWIDYDNDMWQDLFIANGYIQLIPIFVSNEQDPDKLYRNLGNGTFSDVGLSLSLGDTNAGRGMAMSDYDQDGDLDMFVNVVNIDSAGTESSILYQNDLQTSNHWLQVQAQGTYSNRDAFGTQMMISVGGEKWLHEVNGGSSHMSQHSSIAHFGMGAATTVDSLWVIWPTGNVQLLTQITADQRILVVEDSLSFLATPSPALRGFSAYPNPFNQSIKIEFEFGATETARIRITDVRGVVVKSEALPVFQNEKQTWIWNGEYGDGRLAAAGLYSVQILTDNAVHTLRVIKQ